MRVSCHYAITNRNGASTDFVPVSMVEGDLFDKFCKVGQMMRKVPGKPWGGIQIIVTGDFFQLPPVTKGNAMPKFCFEAEMWDETIDLSVNLTKVFRQKDQSRFRPTGSTATNDAQTSWTC